MHDDQNRWRRFDMVAIKKDDGKKTFLSSLYLVRKVKLECSARCRKRHGDQRGRWPFRRQVETIEGERGQMQWNFSDV
jgi:hypothetical protein